jgi:pimeloyl-ACP methyl ester carboxylesterase
MRGCSSPSTSPPLSRRAAHRPHAPRRRSLAEQSIVFAHVVGHAHGGGVALRLAANAPVRVKTVYLLDVGAQASHTGPVFSSSLRLLPLITRLPGGRRFVRERFLRGLLQNSGSDEWLDDSTRRVYTEPMLDSISRVVAMARRLSRAHEPETLGETLSRITAPVTVLLGEVPRPSEPEAAEMAGLELLRPPVRIERLPGVGHFPHEESPDKVVRHLLGDRALIVAHQSAGEP